MVSEASCLNCGNKFTFRLTNSYGKYCSMDCFIAHRRRIGTFAGLSWRKLLMRVAAHSETSMLRVWNVVRNLDEEIKNVVIRDMMQERELVMQEISRVYQSMSNDERVEVSKEMERLDKKLSSQRAIGIMIECPQCGATCGANSALCFKCGTPLLDVGVMKAKEIVIK